ncbi:MAG: hypothetical protein K6B38_12205 [Ruminococcus sp.]|nr:hypothetical protein [Ruminococcus sp.]
MTKLERYLSDTLKYEKFEIDLIIEDVKAADSESRQIIDALIDGKDVSGYSYRDYSVKRLCKENKFNTLAAVLAVSCLKKDYDKYSRIYSKGIK